LRWVLGLRNTEKKPRKGNQMPVKMQKTKSGDFSVRTPGGVKAKHTTKEKALAQARLLNAIDHGFKPKKK